MSTPSLTTTSVATESECAPSDTNIGWVYLGARQRGTRTTFSSFLAARRGRGEKVFPSPCACVCVWKNRTEIGERGRRRSALSCICWAFLFPPVPQLHPLPSPSSKGREEKRGPWFTSTQAQPILRNKLISRDGLRKPLPTIQFIRTVVWQFRHAFVPYCWRRVSTCTIVCRARMW